MNALQLQKVNVGEKFFCPLFSNNQKINRNDNVPSEEANIFERLQHFITD